MMERLKRERLKSSQEPTICFFRFQTITDGECAFEALQNGYAVFCDLSAMESSQILRFKDYMQGVCISTATTQKEICEDYVAYFPTFYHLQVFEN